MRLSRRAAAIVGLLATAALVALALGWFPQALLRAPLESRLQRLVGPGSRVGRVRVVPGRLSAEVHGLVLDAPAYRLEARRLAARLSHRTLTGAGLIVDRLHVEGAVLVLRPPDPAAPPAAPPEGPLVVREIVAEDATVHYEDPTLGGPIVLRGVDLRGGLGEGELAVDAAGGAWQRPRAVPIGPLMARLRVSPALDIDVRVLEAGFERTRLRLAGPLGRVGALRPDLGFELRADLAELQALAPIEPAGGVLEATGRVSGPAEGLHVEARVAAQALRVSGWPVDRVGGDLAYTAGPARAASAAARMGLLGGTGRLEARLQGHDARGRIELRGVDVQRLQRQLGTSANVSGTGSAIVRFQGDIARPLSVEAEVSAEGRAVAVPRFRAEARAEGRVSVQEPSLDLAWTMTVDGSPAREGGPVRLTAVGSARGALPPVIDARVDLLALGGEARGEVSARGANVRRLAVYGRSLDLSRLVDGASGRAEIEATASGPIDALTGTARITVAALGWRGSSLGPLQTDVEARKGAATARIELPLLRASAVVQGPGRSRNPTLTGSATLAATPLAPFAPLLGRGRPLEGTVSATAEFAAPLTSPERSSAHVLVQALEARSGRLAVQAAEPFTLALDPARASVTGLRLDGDGFTARLDGHAGLGASAPLDLRGAAEAHLPAFAPEGWRVEGEARAEVTVTGTVQAPRVEGSATLDGTSVEGPALPPVRLEEARLALTGDAVEIAALRLALAGGAVSIGGRVPLAAAYPKARREPAAPAPREEAALTASWSGIETARLLRHADPAAEPALVATLEGRAELRGGLASLTEPRVTVALPATTGRLHELQVDLAPAELRLESGRVSTGALTLAAGGAAVELAGTADLAARTLDARGRGVIELRALSAFLEEAALTGTSEIDLRVRGPFAAPRPTGTVRLRDATLRARAFPQALTGIGAELALDGATLTLRDTSAQLGGGTLTAGGTARLSGTGLADAAFTLTGRDLAIRYEGLRSRLDADLALTGRTGALRLAGTVRAQRGLYQLDTALEGALTAPEAAPVASPLLRSVALDIRVQTDSPVLVRSNMVRRLEATGRLNVRGDLETPAPVGTLDVEPGGTVVLQGREFVVDSGRLAYTGNWDPELSVRASARLPDVDRQQGTTRDVDVTVAVEGQLMRPRLSLSSDPPLSQLEIASLITTGDSQNPSARLAVGGPAASLLAGRVSRSLSGLGLGQISIQPELVAKEGTVEPGARFTFGRRLTNQVNFVYSASLQDAENTYMELQGTPGHDVDLSVRRTSEGEFIYGAGQRFRFGGARAAPARRERRARVAAVRVEGASPLEPGDLRAALRTGAGDRRSIWDLQDDAERLRRRLAESGYLEAQVGARFEGDEAVFTVRGGHRYSSTVRGMPAPPGLENAVRESLFAEEALENGRALLLRELREHGHLRAVVRAAIEPSDGGRVLAFSAEPGPVLTAAVAFPGAQALSHSRLLDAAGGAGALVTDPAAAVAGIEAAYRSAYFLAARVEPPRTAEEVGGAGLRVVVPVEEGPQARVAAVRFEGASQPEGVLLGVAGLATGSRYDQEQTLAAADRLRAHYYGLGNPAARVAARVQPEGTDLAIVFELSEGERVTVGRVVLQGLRRARESLVRRAVSLEPGDPLDPRKVAEMERRLMDLGLFTRVAATVTEENPATVTVSVDEGDRLRAGYRASYGKEQGTRAELDGELRGLFGAGLRLGARVSAGPDLREVRPYLHLPAFLPTGGVTLSAFRVREDEPLDPENEDGETFTRVQTGGQLQATRPLRDRWNLVYGYHIKKVTVTSPVFPDPISRWVAGLETSLLRDTRDDPMDARRGRFLSASLELAPQALGSDYDFVKGFAQAFFSRPLRRGWTWAHGYRAGLAHVFGGEPLPEEEGFEAGGANSIRGFETGSVGPEGYRFGHQATLVVNQELRYHHPSGLGGVVFYDLGNTWATPSDVSLELRHALGAGLRWSSPVGLLRLDLGVPLGRREGESSYELFFSFGQAF